MKEGTRTCILYIYCMLVREIWKFIHSRVSYSRRASPEGVPGRFAPNPVRPLSRFAPNPVRPLSRFAPIPVRPGSFRPYSRSPRVVSPRFINSALKNEIWKIPFNTIANIRKISLNNTHCLVEACFFLLFYLKDMLIKSVTLLTLVILIS